MTKKKIAIIGGGVGAITTAYAITQTPDWKEKYDITIYQLGWRIGGKGASGRNLEHGGRIEEHGLHIWAGFYDNAFRNMRACYDQLNTLGLRKPDAPLGTFDQAFKPLSHLFLAERVPEAGNPNPWRPWLIDLPRNDVPVGTETKVPGPFEMFLRILRIVIEFLEKGEMDEPGGNRIGIAAPPSLRPHFRALHEHATLLHGQGSGAPAEHKNRLVELIEAAQRIVHAEETPENIAIDPIRRGLYLLDIFLGYAHGIATTDTFASGYDVLDQWEFTDWLRGNGTSDAALGWVSIRGCYDFVFGFPFGDTSRQGDVGAGTAARAMSRLIFGYSTAIFHKMQAGMGDTIFSPYYEVLSELGVRFEFFSAARELRLDPGGAGIAEIGMVRQARLKDGPYQPLVPVRDLPCWPSEPLWDQLVDGDRLKRERVDFECEKEPPTGEPFTLKRGEDFDLVVLGASMGSLPYLTQELAKASPRWRTMLERVKTVGTHAAQYWLTKTAEDLGWDDLVKKHNARTSIPPPPFRTVITGFAEPLDTWADMSHLIGREDWPEDGPKSIAYFCSPAPDGETLAGFTDSAVAWSDRDLVKIWPNADKDGAFDEEVFYPPGPTGFDNQYFRVNMYGSERYVLSVTGSTYHRLAPDESGFDNLILAGDWTRCGLNAGCVEAATMSGIAAASAVTGVELLNVGAEDIPGQGSLPDRAAYLTNSISGAHWPLSGFYARGEMTGWFIFYAMPRAEVAKLLPEGVYLGASPLTPPGTHPVGMSFCRYQNVRGSFIPDCFSMSPYGEATFAIPYTRTKTGGQAPWLYPRRLYVDNSTAIFAGKFFYAMNKKPATISVSDSLFTASDDDGLSIRAEFDQRDDLVPLSTHAAFGAISDLLDMSFVTRRQNGRLLYNAFNLELSHAYVAPASGRIRTADGDPLGFPEAEFEARPLEPVAPRGLPGAFRIWCSWSMTNPLDSKRVCHANNARAWLRRTY